MTTAIQTNVTDEVTPEMKQVLDRVRPERVHAEIGARVTRLTQRHLVRNGENKKGWPTTHFWGRAAKATTFTAAAGETVIIINQIGVRQRYQGGYIYPKNAKYL